MDPMLFPDNGNKPYHFPLVFSEIIQGSSHVCVMLGSEIDASHLIFPFTHRSCLSCLKVFEFFACIFFKVTSYGLPVISITSFFTLNVGYNIPVFRNQYPIMQWYVGMIDKNTRTADERQSG